MAYRPRLFVSRLKALLAQFPVVCILGPRQCGKTTLAKTCLSDWRYLDLEKPSDLAKVADDPEGALRRLEQRVIFDEAQRFPPLFPVLRSFMDEKRSFKGRFVLLGSVSPHLTKKISESLAGRVGFLDLTPFLLGEVDHQENLWVRGGFPEAYLQAQDSSRFDWFESYTRTFIERDLGQMGIGISPIRMRALWTMLSHLHGGIWNASEPASSLAVSYHTVNRYVDILEKAFLVRKLPPFFVNIGKRLVKSPKIYLRDSGLLHYFLSIRNREDLDGHPKKGMSWEGFVVEEILGHLSMRGSGVESYFFRTSSGHEIDLVIKKGRRLVPVEVKLHTAPQKSDVKGLVAGMADLDLKEGYVVRPEGEEYSLGSGIHVISLHQFLNQVLI